LHEVNEDGRRNNIIQEDIVNAQNKGQNHDAYDAEVNVQQKMIADFQNQIDNLNKKIKQKKEKGNIPISLGKMKDNRQAFSHFDTAVDILYSNITGKKGKMDDILKNVERLKIQDLNRRLNNTLKAVKELMDNDDSIKSLFLPLIKTAPFLPLVTNKFDVFNVASNNSLSTYEIASIVKNFLNSTIKYLL